MPEAPYLEVIKEVLNQWVVGLRVQAVRVHRPTVLRSLAGEFVSDVEGRTLEGFQRRGKFLLASLSGDRVLAINPMLTGALQHCSSS